MHNERLIASDKFEGPWEQSNRSPMAAAVFGLLIVGLIYFNAQSLLLSLVVSISSITQFLFMLVPTLCLGGAALYAFHLITQKNFRAVNDGTGSEEGA